MPHAGNPWETGGSGKYQYYPGGDRSAQPKDAPSAINTVVVPDVNLPKVRTQMHTCCCERRPEDAVVMDNSEGMPQTETHEKLTCDYYRSCTRSTTSGARTVTRWVILKMGEDRSREQFPDPGSVV